MMVGVFGGVLWIWNPRIMGLNLQSRL